jgi:hypothetical protein
MNRQIRKVGKVYVPQATSDGAGVRIKRSVGTRALDYLDPFLLFDHFGSDNRMNTARAFRRIRIAASKPSHICWRASSRIATRRATPASSALAMCSG